MEPASFDELKALVDAGAIEIILDEDQDDGTTRILLCDHRRTYEEGEIYEIIV